MRLPRLVITAVLSCGLAAATALPAAAAHRVTSDPRGDTSATFDITKLDVNNKTKELVVKVEVPGYRATGGDAPDASLLGAEIHTRGIDYYVEASPQSATGDAFVFFQPEDEAYQDGEEGGAPCPGLRAVFRDGAAKLVIPQKCFGKDKGSVRVVAQFRGYSEEGGTLTDQGTDYTDEHPRHIKRG